MPTAYHMVHYRRFEVDEGNLAGRTLEAACRHVLAVNNPAGVPLVERAEDRLFEIGGDAGSKILLNKVADLSSAVFGELCLVETRGLQALLQLSTEQRQLSDLTMAEIYALDERAAPSGSQFLRGLLYWLAIGDHLFFVKTQAMTGDLLHTYLNWLLKPNGLPIDLAWRLQAQLDKSATGADVGEVRKLRVGGRTVMPAEDDGEEITRERATKRTVGLKSFASDKALPIAEAVFGPLAAESLVETLGPGEYLAAEAIISVRGRRTERSKLKMKELYNSLDDDPHGMKVEVEGPDGKISNGDAILRTRMPFDVAHAGSTLLEFENVADQLQTVYRRFVEDAKITA